jgi:hypothetical protein
MSIRMIKQKQAQLPHESCNDEPHTSSPVLIESVLLITSDQSQTPMPTMQQIHPSLVHSATPVNQFETVHTSSIAENSNSSSSFSTVYPTLSNRRVHVPVHNASQWFNGPDLKSEKIDRMGRVMDSIVQRQSVRPLSNYGYV